MGILERQIDRRSKKSRREQAWKDYLKQKTFLEGRLAAWESLLVRTMSTQMQGEVLEQVNKYKEKLNALTFQ